MNTLLINALKAHYFDNARRELVGTTPELTAELDTLEKLIAMLDKNSGATMSTRWRLKLEANGWYWMRRPPEKPVIAYVQITDGHVVVHAAGQPYQLELLSDFEFSGPIQPPPCHDKRPSTKNS